MRQPSLPALGLSLCGVAACVLVTYAVGVRAGPLSSQHTPMQRTANYAQDESSDALRQAGRHLASVTARTMESVVNIESTRNEKDGKETEETGSGVIMKNPRAGGLYVITNRHVVEGARLNQIDVQLNDGRVLKPTEKLEDAASDLAVLRLPEVAVSPAQFGDSDNLDIGHFVLAMGSPFGLTESVTLGIISAKGRRSLELPGRSVINQDFLQTDAAINPGNSGGPLIDLDGRVIGINTAIASQGGGNEGIGFSIPSNLVQFVVNQLLDYGRVRRGFLGVQLDERFDFEAARRYGLDRKQGARVTQVVPNSPAALAGIRPDDVVLNFDGFVVQDERDLINKVSVTPVNKQIRVVILRAGRQQAVNVVLSEKSDAAMSQLSVPEVDTKTPVQLSRFSVMPMTSPLAVQTGYAPSQHGLLVKFISESRVRDPDTLQLYDVIEEVSRKRVSSQRELDAALADHTAGEPVIVKVQRVVNGTPESRLVLYVPPSSSVNETGAGQSPAGEPAVW